MKFCLFSRLLTVCIVLFFTAPELPAQGEKPLPPVPLQEPAQPAAPSPQEPALVKPVPVQPPAAAVPPRKLDLPPLADISYRNVTLEEDTVWRGSIMVTGWVTVPPQVTLTIEAGTSVYFVPEQESGPNDAGLLVHGRIVAVGATGTPVLFRGRFEKPEAGDWQGIVLLATDKRNILEECRVEGASIGIELLHSLMTLRHVDIIASGTGIRLRDAILDHVGGGASDCKVGIQAIESELDLKNIVVSGNRQGIVAAGGALLLTGATVADSEGAALTVNNGKMKVSGSRLTGNGTGLRVTGSEGTIAFNRILDNREAGLNLHDSRLRITRNEISRNRSVGVRIIDGNNVLWGNALEENNGRDLEYSGELELAAMGNWWGETSSDKVLSRIRTLAKSARVLYLPLLAHSPQSGI